MIALRRELGLLKAVVYGVGLILGAGLYAILGEATGVTGGSIVNIVTTGRSDPRHQRG